MAVGVVVELITRGAIGLGGAIGSQLTPVEVPTIVVLVRGIILRTIVIFVRAIIILEFIADFHVEILFFVQAAEQTASLGNELIPEFLLLLQILEHRISIPPLTLSAVILVYGRLELRGERGEHVGGDLGNETRHLYMACPCVPRWELAYIQIQRNLDSIWKVCCLMQKMSRF